MKNQIEYQRNVIREEYVNEDEISKRMEDYKLNRLNRSLQRGEPPGVRRMEKTVGIIIPENRLN